MKILPSIFKKITAEPFEVQEYNGQKVKLYYMDDEKILFDRFVPRGKFAVWCSNGEEYALLVQKGYYEAVKDFYSEKVNTIWLDFVQDASGTQKKIARKYTLINLLILGIILGICLALFSFVDFNILMIGGMAVLFFALMLLSRKQRNETATKVKEKNVVATDKVKNAVGAQRFENILKGQQAFYDSWYAYEETEELDNEGTDEIEELDNESNDKEAKDSKKGE